MKEFMKDPPAWIWHLWGILLLIASTCMVSVFAERNLQNTLAFAKELYRAIQPGSLP